MRLQGLHHITAITADAPANVNFHVRVLGLRLVKKTINFDDPSVYHLYFGDEVGTPGSILTFFEFPGAARGRAGAGMVHTIRWRVGSADSIAWWEDRLAHLGVDAVRGVAGALRFADPEGLAYELVVAGGSDAPLTASAPDIPPAHALQGFDGVSAYAATPSASAPLLSALGFTPADAPGAWASCRAISTASGMYPTLSIRRRSSPWRAEKTRPSKLLASSAFTAGRRCWTTALKRSWNSSARAISSSLSSSSNRPSL